MGEGKLGALLISVLPTASSQGLGIGSTRAAGACVHAEMSMASPASAASPVLSKALTVARQLQRVC